MHRILSVGLVISDVDFRDSLVLHLGRMNARVAFAVSDPDLETDRVEHTNPDVLILDFSRPSAHAVMAELKRVSNPPVVIGAHPTPDAEMILNALRAGSREFICQPLDTLALERMLEAVSSERMTEEARHHVGKTLGFTSSGGGCGATLLACHVGAELQRITEGQTLVADFDLAAGMVGYWLNGASTYSALDAAQNLNRLDISYWKGIVTNTLPRLDVLNAPRIMPFSELPGPRRFAEVLRFARSYYTWNVIDLGVALTPLSVGLLTGLDAIYVVCTPDISSVYQARRIVRSVIEQGIHQRAVKLVLSRVCPGPSTINIDELRTVIGVDIAVILPEAKTPVEEAQSAKRPVGATCELGRRIAEFAARCAGKAPAAQSPPSLRSLRQLLPAALNGLRLRTAAQRASYL